MLIAVSCHEDDDVNAKDNFSVQLEIYLKKNEEKVDKITQRDVE